MNAELMEGLRLAGVGMGLVFATLIALMVILFALGKMFPGEEVEQDTTADAPATAADEPVEPPAPLAHTETLPQAEAPAAAAAPAPPPNPAPAPAPAKAHQGVSGERIAALAVSVYLAMEQEEAERAAYAEAPADAVAWAGPQSAQPLSSWGSLGRAALWRSQGRRPPAFGSRSHSAYTPTKGQGA